MKKHLPFLFLLLPILIFFSPVIFQHKLPIPADTIPGLYHPMRDAVADQYPNGPPYKNFLITDSVKQQFPWRQYSIEQLKLGHLPWWNPYNFSGTPHLANFQSATFYPLNLIFWLTNFVTGWNLLIISQQVLGAVFMFLLLRYYKLSPLSSIFGSLTWIFSGFFIAWLEWNTAVHVAIWTPLILLCLDKLIIHQKNIYLPLLVFALISQSLAGYPQPWVYLSLLQGAYLLFRLKSKFSPKLSIKLLIAYLAFLLVASVQILPTLQYMPLTNRDHDQGGLAHNLQRDDWFLPFQNIVQLIVPDFFGNPATLNYWGVFNYTEFVTFIGIIPFIFLLISLYQPKKTSTQKFFIATLIITLIFTFKHPLSLLITKSALPFFSSAQPSRIIVVLDFLMPLLAAFGFDYFQKHPKSTKPALITTSALVASLWLIVFYSKYKPLGLLSEKNHTTLRNLILPTAELAISVLILFPFLVLKPKKKFNTFLTIFIIIISVGSGVRFARKFTPFSNPEFLYPQTQILTFLAQNQGLYRYSASDNRILVPNLNLPYKLYTIEGYDPMYLADYGGLITATHQNSIPDQSQPFNRHVLTDAVNSPILDLLGVKYILSFSDLPEDKFNLVMTEGQTKLFQNNQVFPRAFITNSDNPFELSAESVKPANIVVYQPQHIEISAHLANSGKLILTDAYYPDWVAMLNGQPIPIENWHGLRAVNLPEGDHEIVFEYRHPQLQWLGSAR